ncbi:MAG: hypothetical protein BRC47_04435 [Cyanobacteria bacterium QS_7_48_42]|jgi:hypothetical protein|nr:MAG: hypothetical protein BRC35_10860 [Cyanobacteria bacterium QH_10_48_56]PSO59072.1 MAG: hypothetical protein BRC39_11980 [Cyanobacteria bacterium QH_7_48_89]PSO62360.1 MAG: hypothetical protein BRC36_10225 [Cyanobacteria bacterium QH_2_48_84]PSO65259.1 MAG: hypothetical protein BRC38_09515 [Cyanobacteria bacterium QH_6_48_35]PSO67712.1 MAG: hypothetical protein BRC42_15435 [Cyanobacteria bacterium QS_1_48_34]PSO74152.1 MAG: hypothetical protein BRC37_07720 [Cyanobacteria bacterium QH_3_4
MEPAATADSCMPVLLRSNGNDAWVCPTQMLDLSVVNESFQGDHRFVSLPLGQDKRHGFSETFTLDVNFRS